MVCRSLGGGVGGVGLVRKSFVKLSGRTQRPIDFVGGDLEEAEAVFLGSCRKILPVVESCPKKIESALDIGLNEGLGPTDGAIHMGFCREIEERIDFVLFEQPGGKLGGRGCRPPRAPISLAL